MHDKILTIILQSLERINYREIIKFGKETVGKNISGDKTFRFDKIIEESIVRNLRNLGFRGLIRGEENPDYGGDIKEGVILIDPIDGSSNALRGIPYYATLIAYAERDSIESVTRAVVYAPELKEKYVAMLGEGAYLIKNNIIQRLMITDAKSPVALIEVLSAYSLQFSREIFRFGKIRRLGSAGLAIVYTASNLLDAVMDIGRVMRMPDIAAPYLILKEAGGEAIIEPKKPLRADIRVNLLMGKPSLVRVLYRKFWTRRKRS